MILDLPISTATRNDIDSCWEEDTMEYMEHHSHTCLNIWIDESFENNDFDDDTMDHLDSSTIVLFRILVSRLEERIDFIENYLRDLKYDGRIRVVLNCEDPVKILQILRTKPFLKIAPYMVNSAAIKKTEECTSELTKLKGDIVISSKLSDFYKFCNFSTILWINYASDPRREVMEKKVSKTGVVMIRTESKERGLRYLETHSHLGYLEFFRIIIGDGKINQNDDTLKEYQGFQKAKRFTRPTALTIVPMRRRLNTNKDEESTTIELVEILRNRLKWTSPILIYYYDALSKNKDLDIYKYHNVKLTDDYSIAEYFALMKPLPWIHDFSREFVDVNKKGVLKIVGIRCNDILPKKKNMSSDPYAIVKVGKDEKKTKKINNTLNPVWNLNWEFKCSLSDRIVVSIWDWDLIGKHHFEGQIVIPSLNQLLPSPTQILEVTRALCPKGKINVQGTITLEMGFDYLDQRQSKQKYFGLPLEESYKQCKSGNIPHITDKCIEALWINGLKLKGIFKLPGNNENIEKLKKLFETGEDIDLSKEDPIDIAQLLRGYIRDLPDGIIPNRYYRQFKKTKTIEKRKDQIKHLKNLISQIPDVNKIVLTDLMSLLHEITLNEEENQTSIKDLSKCLAPGLFLSREKTMKPQHVMDDTQTVIYLLEYMLIHYNKLFDVKRNKVKGILKMNQKKKRDKSKLKENQWIKYDYKIGQIYEQLEPQKQDDKENEEEDENSISFKKKKLETIKELLEHIELLEKEKGLLDDSMTIKKRRLEDEMLILEEEILLLEDIELNEDELRIIENEMKDNEKNKEEPIHEDKEEGKLDDEEEKGELKKKLKKRNKRKKK